MTELKKEFEFQLTTPIEFHAANGGSIQQGTVLFVQAPSTRQIKEVAKLRQALSRALIEKANEQRGGDAAKNDEFQDEESASAGMLMILSASDCDFVELLDCFRRILVSDCCKINNEVIFRDSLFNKMSEADFTNLLGRYIYNFFMLSLMSKLKK